MKVLAIDQGTTGTKSFTLRDDGDFTFIAGAEHEQLYPHAGWVEHNPEELLACVNAGVARAGKVDAIGIDNQGETIIAWDARTGRPCYNAIVWQDNRTMEMCEALKARGGETVTLEKAGLPLDPYFSASKMRWIIDNVDEAKSLLRLGRLRLGTSDAFFLDRVTGEFATDVTTASRTSLMSLDTQQWDDELLTLFGVPRECLPDIRCTTGDFGTIGKTPVAANIVDQQAALFGHGCSAAGDAKITFGTGAFALAVSGSSRPLAKQARLAATIAWKQKGESATFALDGAVYNAGSALNWVRKLGLFGSFQEIDHFELPSALSRGICFVPALSGLACPHWDRNAAGLWIGMDLATSKQDLVQAILEGVALRAAEVVSAIATISPLAEPISIDGGLAKNPYFGQFLADALNRPVKVASSTELTAMGTARMAMKGVGCSELPPLPEPARTYAVNTPVTPAQHARFAEAVARARSWR
ncbi:MAG: FGGY family carbohydrate kinase [Parvibaculaceae bacterium]